MQRNNTNIESPYDDSEMAASRPLGLDEIEALMLDGGRLFERNKDRVRHLLERMSATIKDHQRRMSDLHDDVDRIRSERAGKEHPMARASAALSELDPEQQRKLLDINYISAVEELDRFRIEVENMRLLAINDINRVRLLLASLLNDKSLDNNSNEKIRALLDTINLIRTT